ncbi:hypothetical protein PDE_09248 [Penicillium oxalicum 114-2]|uniref:Mid2 domain-containing protein n=1 Tax=Penicillium oxalicum (strain 114-2 / CGMCC 5302) TaxID=933388 RepID=S7ZV41_PENO1|nr:hypothetical protein PDE_09248 [Penicillium oxalicum 114-2]
MIARVGENRTGGEFRGYYLANGTPGSIVGDCLSDVSSGMTLTYGSTSNGLAEFMIATTTLSDSSTVSAIGVVSWNIKNAETVSSTSTASTTLFPSTQQPSSVQQSSLIQSSSTMQLTSAICTNPAIPASVVSPVASLDSSMSSTGSDGSLTTGTKLGIGVGIGVGVIGVIALLVALYLFRQRKQGIEPFPVHSIPPYYVQGPGITVYQAPYNPPHYPSELESKPTVGQ